MNFLIPDFREESIAQLHKLQPNDVRLFKTDEINWSYTIVLRLRDETINVIGKFIDSLKKIDSHQYYYPLNQLHMTLIGNLPIEIPQDKIISAIQKLITQEMKFALFGVGSNQLCSSISAYPVGFDLSDLRTRMRDEVGHTGDDFSVILPAYEKVCWINYMRYFRKPHVKLLEFLLAQKDTHFGTFEFECVELYKNRSRTLDPKRSELLSRICL